MEGKPQPNQDLETGLIEMIEGVDPPEICEVDEQRIHKVPPSIREVHPEAYTPKIISIGPFHNPRGPNATRDNNNILWSMEDLKLKYLRGFLNRTDLSVEAFVPKLRVLENRIRNCYAGGPVIYKSNDFLNIIITDACFIIELFIRFYQGWTKKDPILSKHWLANDIRMDLLLLENQLPFFVLEEIFIFAGLNRIFGPFVQIIIHYFQEFKEFFNKKQNINIVSVSPKHFVDLLRIFSMPSSSPPQSSSSSSSKKSKEKIDHVYSASELSEAGLVFEVSKDSECLLDLEFDDKKCVLKMPCLSVGDDTEIFLKNILAFEQCHYTGSGYIGQYLRLLDFLINTGKDVSILVEKGIIINYMGDISSVATMINSLSKNLYMPDLHDSHYHYLCLRLNGFYENPCNKYKAVFIHEYFNTPWKIASTIAAISLLVLTLLQTILSVYSVFK